MKGHDNRRKMTALRSQTRKRLRRRYLPKPLVQLLCAIEAPIRRFVGLSVLSLTPRIGSVLVGKVKCCRRKLEFYGISVDHFQRKPTTRGMDFCIQRH
jgi:hypothetical protein